MALRTKTRALILATLTLPIFAAQEALFVSEARADQTKGRLTGIVRDRAGNPIMGASVTVVSPALQGEKSSITDSLGLYRIPNLPPGEYELVVVINGFRPHQQKGIELRAGTTIRVNVALHPSKEGADTMVREVEVDAPAVDVGSATVGQSMDEEFSRRVPVALPGGKGAATRSFEAIAEATPTARNDTYGTSVAGSTSPENQYLIDGMSVNNPGFGLNGSPLSVEFLEEVKVDTGGYMPEYGRATGGVISAVVKSGSNKFHGGVWANFTPGGLEGRRKVVIREGQTIVTEPKLSWIGDTGFDLGGPIIKDKLWFYTGFQVARTVYNIRTSLHRRLVDPATGEVMVDPDTDFTLTERIPGTEESRKAQMTQFQAVAKLTFRPVERHTVSVTGLYLPRLSGGGNTYGIDPENGRPEVGNAIGDFAALAHKYDGGAVDILSNWNAESKNDKWLFDTRFNYHHERAKRLPSDGSRVGSTNGLAGVSQVIWRRNTPFEHSITEFRDDLSNDVVNACANIEIPDPMDPTITNTTVTCPLQQYVTGGPGFLQDQKFERVGAQHTVTFFGVGAGHHEVKFGAAVDFTQYTNLRGYSGDRTLREAVNGGSFLDLRQFGFLQGPDDPFIIRALQWTTNSLLVGGFVQESWDIMDKVTLNVGLRYDAQLIYGGDGEIALSLPDQISPRVGIIYDPTQKGKSKLFANYARYYEAVPLNISDRAGSGEPQIASLHDAATCDPRDVDQQRGACQDPANRIPLGGPTSPDQEWLVFSVGKTPVDPKLRSQSSDEFVTGGEYEIFHRARLGLMYQRKWLTRAIEDMSRDEAQTYFIGNPGYGIAKDFPKATRNYDALTVYLQKTFSDNFLVSASYTVAWLRGNLAGLFRPETGQLDPNINSDFDLISLLPNRTGPLPGDNRHTFKIFGAGQINFANGSALTLGGAFRASSGGPSDYLGSHPLYGSDEVFILPRGSGNRLPWVFRIDTSVGYKFLFTEDFSLAATVDVFNVANFQAVTAIDDRYTSADVLPIRGGDKDDLSGLQDIEGNPVVPNPNFGNPVAYQTPRQFRFGLRLTF